MNFLFKVLNKALGIKMKSCVKCREKNPQYLVRPALCLAVTVIKFLQRHFGVDEAYVGLELVFDGFDVLMRERQQERPHIWLICTCFQQEINTIINTSPS